MKRLSWLLLLVIACVSARANATTVKTTRWRPVYIGIDQATGSIDGSDASVAYALRVDLRAPGIRFYTAPRQGSLNTVASTTSQFLLKYGLQAAINANFFAPCCNATSEQKSVLGLAVSDGNTVSAPDGTPGQNASLLIDQKNHASIAETTDTTDISKVFNAVTGSGIIVQDGLNVGGDIGRASCRERVYHPV